MNCMNNTQRQSTAEKISEVSTLEPIWQMSSFIFHRSLKTGMFDSLDVTFNMDLMCNNKNKTRTQTNIEKCAVKSCESFYGPS